MSPEDEKAWEATIRESFGVALAAAMDFMRLSYADAITERDKLRERVKYLEQRVEELRKGGA